MMDPFTTFGAAASAVQLADIAVRASVETYAFLSAVKDAGKDIRLLRESLRDVESNIRILRNYINKFSKSKTAIEGHEVLPETVTRSLAHFHDDMVILKSILPRKPSPSLAQKINWAYIKRKVPAVQKRLNERKADLVVALAIISSQQDLYIREDLGDITRAQKESEQAIRRQTALIQDHAQRQHVDHAELLQHVRHASGDVDEAHLIEIRSATTIFASNTDLLTKIIRSELRSNLKPIIERTLHKSETLREARLCRIEAMIDQMSIDLGLHMSSMEASSPLERGTKHTCYSWDHTPTPAPWETETTNDQIRPEKRSVAEDTSDRHSWYLETRFGSIQVDVQTSNQGRSDSPAYCSTTSLYVHFRPSQAWMPLPGVSIFYSTAPNQQGFYMLAPIIRTFPIIHDDHPIWYTMADENVEGVRHLLLSGEVSPRSQDEEGSTLLHVSAHRITTALRYVQYPILLVMFRKQDECLAPSLTDLLLLKCAAFHTLPEICKLLVSCYGLSWDQCNSLGNTPARTAGYSISWTNKLPQLTEMIETIELAERNGEDVSDTFRGMLGRGPLPYIESSGPYFDRFQYFSSRFDVDVWHVFFEVWKKVWWKPTTINMKSIEAALGNGLNPNFNTVRTMRPLLVEAIHGVRKLKDERRDDSIVRVVDGERSLNEEEDFGEEKVRRLGFRSYGPQHWDMIALLIEAGADIYWMNPECFEKASRWTNIWTPWSYATAWKVTPEWEVALTQCGLRFDEVCREDMQACRPALRLRGARRSAVDELMLALPSASGLRCRICRRRYCFQGHGYSALEL